MSLSKPVLVAIVGGTFAGIYFGRKGIRYLLDKIYKGVEAYAPKADDPNWEQVGSLSDIIVYPIKSCGAVALESALCTSLGLKDGWLRDRFLMVIDSEDNFITARNYPELLSVKPQVRNTILTLEYNNIAPLNVNLAEVIAFGKPGSAHVWNVKVDVYDCGPDAQKWFTEVLNRPNAIYRLDYYASQECRPLRDAAHRFYKFSKKDTGALPDETSYNLINDASVADLNRRLEAQGCKVTHRNFRPNFLLQGAVPFDEDRWQYVKIGHNIFEVVKPCTRCVLTTIDPETGVRNEKSEPLTTLRSYRQATNPEEIKETGTSPKMGVQMALRSTAGEEINVNEPVYVIYKK